VQHPQNGGALWARLSPPPADLAVHTEEHPNVIALKRRIERMETEVATVSDQRGRWEKLEREQIAQTEGELDRLRVQLAGMISQLEALDLRVERIPDNQEAIEALTQRAGVMRESYLEFLRKVQDAELAETLEAAQQGPRVSVLDPASPPAGPVTSARMLMLMGLAGAFGLALVVGLGLELIDPVALGAGHVEATGLTPLLGSVRELA
jgi:uncharacterized protein involved in exopolysaccharide biosynthesis